jgi:thiol-disulfide isomerase/thioredoxin
MLSCVFLCGALGFAAADDEKKEATLKEKISELQKEVATANKELGEKFQGAKTDEERAAIRGEFMSIQGKVGEKILAAVKAMPKDEFAFDATMIAMRSNAKGASDFLMENFIDDERLAKAIPQIAASPNGEKALAQLAEKSKNKDIKGIALFMMVSTEIENADSPRTGKPLPEKEAAAKIAAAALKLDGVMKEYGDVKIPAARGTGKSIADSGKDLKYFIEHLTIGKVAPDAECELMEDGKTAKLKDYRGKVVVLDIWATWCGPCRAMIPHEREMVKHFEGKPFMLLSVSADDKKETLTKFLEKEEMPWTHWWAGRENAFLKTYQVKFFPTIYVLDSKGVIRAKGLRGDALEKFVEKLLEEEAKNKS